jgi:hypothetical protein
MAKRRTTIGDNPLDAVIPVPLADQKASEQDLASARTYPEPEKPPRVIKERLTIHLPVELIDRAKNAVYWTPGLTLAGLAEGALAKALEELEKERGEPFPPRREELKGGRPLK